MPTALVRSEIPSISTHLHDIGDTLLWLGAGLVALIAAPVLILARAALPDTAFTLPRARTPSILETDLDDR